jgi:folylpolyglutamate synthase/dihydropteroate synthase
MANPAAGVGAALDAILADAELGPRGTPLRVLICGSLYLAGAVLRENG